MPKTVHAPSHSWYATEEAVVDFLARKRAADNAALPTNGHVYDPRTNVRTTYREGRIVSVGLEGPLVRRARLLLGAAALRRSSYWGDRENARMMLRHARVIA